MEQYVVVGNTRYEVTDAVGTASATDAIWVAGIFRDEEQAKAFLEEANSLANWINALTQSIRDIFNNPAEPADPTDADFPPSLPDLAHLEELHKRLQSLDPKAVMPDYTGDTDSIMVKYFQMPGELRDG